MDTLSRRKLLTSSALAAAAAASPVFAAAHFSVSVNADSDPVLEALSDEILAIPARGAGAKHAPENARILALAMRMLAAHPQILEAVDLSQTTADQVAYGGPPSSGIQALASALAKHGHVTTEAKLRKHFDSSSAAEKLAAFTHIKALGVRSALRESAASLDSLADSFTASPTGYHPVVDGLGDWRCQVIWSASFFNGVMGIIAAGLMTGGIAIVFGVAFFSLEQAFSYIYAADCDPVDRQHRV
jgi:hypothetical protein